MPNHTPHGDLACVDVEALLGDANIEIAHLQAENADLRRRLDNVIHAKNEAIEEAVSLRDTTPHSTPV